MFNNVRYTVLKKSQNAQEHYFVKSLVLIVKLLVFQAFFRSTDIWSFMLRAKMLVRTRQAVAVGHHRSAHQIKGLSRERFACSLSVMIDIELVQHFA
jgi:hypothetical protein